MSANRKIKKLQFTLTSYINKIRGFYSCYMYRYVNMYAFNGYRRVLY